jgi:hypothetical protein
MKWEDVEGSNSGVSSSTILTSAGVGGCWGKPQKETVTVFINLMEIRTGSPFNTSYDGYSL